MTYWLINGSACMNLQQINSTELTSTLGKEELISRSWIPTTRIAWHLHFSPFFQCQRQNLIFKFFFVVLFKVIFHLICVCSYSLQLCINLPGPPDKRRHLQRTSQWVTATAEERIENKDRGEYFCCWYFWFICSRNCAKCNDLDNWIDTLYSSQLMFAMKPFVLAFFLR